MADERISVKRIALLLGILLLFAVALFARWVIYSHLNEFLLIASLSALYYYFSLRGLLNRICFTAIVSLATAILNPVPIHFLILYTGLPWTNTAEHWTFFYGITAVVTGHIALRKIKRAPSPLRGRTAAIVGLVFGYILIIGCVLVLILMGHAMAGMSPV